MSIHKVKTYAKLVGIFVVFLAAIVFLIQNSDEVSIKFLFWQTPEAPMFIFVLSVAGGGVLIFKISTKVGKVIREVGQLRRQEQSRQKLVKQVKTEIEQKQKSPPSS